MKKQIAKILANILALYAGSVIFAQVNAANYSTLLLGGIVLWLVNLVVRPLIVLITIPVNLLSLGLFSLVINTFMVLLVGEIVQGLYVKGFITAFLLAALISVVNIIVLKMVKKK